MEGQATISIKELDRLRDLELDYAKLLNEKKVATITKYLDDTYSGSSVEIELHDSCNHLTKILEEIHQSKEADLKHKIKRLEMRVATKEMIISDLNYKETIREESKRWWKFL